MLHKLLERPRMFPRIAPSAGRNDVPNVVGSPTHKWCSMVLRDVLGSECNLAVGALPFMVPEHRLPFRDGMGTRCSGSSCPVVDIHHSPFLNIPLVPSAIEGMNMVRVALSNRSTMRARLRQFLLSLFWLRPVAILRGLRTRCDDRRVRLLPLLRDSSSSSRRAVLCENRFSVSFSPFCRRISSGLSRSRIGRALVRVVLVPALLAVRRAARLFVLDPALRAMESLSFHAVDISQVLA